MDSTENDGKIKRNRINPTKKWTTMEEIALVSFLISHRAFENPTARVYYRRFAQESNYNIDWNVIRSKVRNMKASYKKAKDWLASKNKEGKHEVEVKKNLLKIFAYYYEFEELFDRTPPCDYAAHKDDSLESTNNFTTKEKEIMDPLYDLAIKEESLDSVSNNNINSCNTLHYDEEKEKAQENDGSPREKKPKGIYSRTAISDIMQMQNEMITLKRQKLDHDMATKDRELYLKERELKLKEREIELKEKEIQSQEKLKILELEMKERLAMTDMAHKYK